MAFHDALFGDRASIDGVVGQCADSGVSVLAAISRADVVAVTTLGLLDLLVLRPLDLIVDARLQDGQRPYLKNLAGLTVGIGAGFAAGVHCDVALPVHSGRAAVAVATDADEQKRLRERFVYADRRGLWQTAVDLGSRAFRNFVVGHVSGAMTAASTDGILVGIARDGTEVLEGDVLAEVEPRVRQATWTGMDRAGRATAKAVMRAIDAVDAERRMQRQRLAEDAGPGDRDG